jgi:hypothetical protein
MQAFEGGKNAGVRGREVLATLNAMLCATRIHLIRSRIGVLNRSKNTQAHTIRNKQMVVPVEERGAMGQS